MYILEKLLILIIFRKCIAFNYISFNHKYNFNKNLTQKNIMSGYDCRNSKKENYNISNFKILLEKKKLLDKLNSEIPTIKKIELIEIAKMNDILTSEEMSTNLLNGGLFNDFNFTIKN
jgi:hypothetical protein